MKVPPPPLPTPPPRPRVKKPRPPAAANDFWIGLYITTIRTIIQSIVTLSVDVLASFAIS